MSKKKHSNYAKEVIRNLPAFLKAYFNTEQGKQALNRPVRYKEVTEQDSKGRTLTHREVIGHNTLAHAMAGMNASN